MSDTHDLVVVAQTTTSNSPFADTLCVRAPKGTVFPAVGDWYDHGRIGRVRTIDFRPDPAGHLCYLLEDGAVANEGDGYVVAAKMVGDHAVTCLYVRPGTQLVADTGYKLRGEAHILIEGPGKARYLTPGEIAARSGGTPLSATLADALMRAGLASKEGL